MRPNKNVAFCSHNIRPRAVNSETWLESTITKYENADFIVINELAQKAKQGDIESIAELAICYQYGLGNPGIAVDNDKMFVLLEEAAKKGHDHAKKILEEFKKASFYPQKYVEISSQNTTSLPLEIRRKKRGVKDIPKSYATINFDCAGLIWSGFLSLNDQRFDSEQKRQKHLRQLTILKDFLFKHTNTLNHASIKFASYNYIQLDGERPNDRLTLPEIVDLTSHIRAKDISLTIAYNASRELKRISDKEIEDLFQTLSVNPRITGLSFGGYYTGYSPALAQCLRNNKTLKTLNLRGFLEDINPNSYIAILLSPERLDDDAVMQVSKELADALGADDSLESNSSLEEINLSKNSLRKGIYDFIEVIRKNRSLRKIDLSSNEISYEGALKLAEALEENKTLTHLVIDDNSIGRTGGAEIVKAINKNQTLQSLSMRDINTENMHEITEALQDNHSLRSLDLGKNRFSLTSVENLGNYLKKNKNLQTLILSEGDIGYFSILFSALKDSHLKSLNLSKTRIYKSAISELGKTLRTHQFLEELDLGFRNSDDLGFRNSNEISDLGNALKENKSLRKLNFEGEKYLSFNSNDKDICDITSLGEALKVNETLEELNLRNNKVTDESLKVIADAISSNLTLRTLDVTGCRSYRSYRSDKTRQDPFLIRPLYITNEARKRLNLPLLTVTGYYDPLRIISDEEKEKLNKEFVEPLVLKMKNKQPSQLIEPEIASAVSSLESLSVRG